MSTETPSVESEDIDLDAFSADFFGQKQPTEEPASSEEAKEEPVEDSDATIEETHDDGDDTPADEDEETSEEDEEESVEDTPPEPKKKNRFQERIDELTNARREAERKAAALEERLAKLEQNEKTDPKPQEKTEEVAGPQPDDKNEDGTEKYPLGEFDPSYIRDLTRHTLEQERVAMKAKEEQESQQKAIEAEKAALAADWQAKLGPAQERYPDFQEKGEQLFDTFAGIDQAYGEYLTATIMSMDFGPDVLYHLANNVDEAQKIVASGPTKATIALGRLEAKFAASAEEKQQARPKVSKAPTPPIHLNKGSAVSVPEVPADTDDLDAFTAQFFKKR